MKKGQLLSQPFFYIFAIIVIGLLLVFGFKYIGKLLKVGCEVETIDLVRDIQAEVNQLRALSFGSSVQCSFSRSSSGDSCEFIVPDGASSICFVDTTTGQQNQIPAEFSSIRTFISEFGGGASAINANLFFAATEGASCEAEPFMIKNLDLTRPVCLDLTENNAIILENVGNKVTVKSS